MITVIKSFFTTICGANLYQSDIYAPPISSNSLGQIRKDNVVMLIRRYALENICSM